MNKKEKIIKFCIKVCLFGALELMCHIVLMTVGIRVSIGYWAALLTVALIAFVKTDLYVPIDKFGDTAKFWTAFFLFYMPAFVLWSLTIIAMSRGPIPSLNGLGAKLLIMMGMVVLLKSTIKKEFSALDKK